MKITRFICPPIKFSYYPLSGFSYRLQLADKQKELSMLTIAHFLFCYKLTNISQNINTLTLFQ